MEPAESRIESLGLHDGKKIGPACLRPVVESILPMTPMDIDVFMFQLRCLSASPPKCPPPSPHRLRHHRLFSGIIRGGRWLHRSPRPHAAKPPSPCRCPSKSSPCRHPSRWERMCECLTPPPGVSCFFVAFCLYVLECSVLVLSLHMLFCSSYLSYIHPSSQPSIHPSIHPSFLPSFLCSFFLSCFLSCFRILSSFL